MGDVDSSADEAGSVAVQGNVSASARSRRSLRHDGRLGRGVAFGRLGPNIGFGQLGRGIELVALGLGRDFRRRLCFPFEARGRETVALPAAPAT